MNKVDEKEDKALRYKAFVEEEKIEELEVALQQQIALAGEMDKKYTILGKALIEMRVSCREAGRSSQNYKKWEKKRLEFLKALVDIEGKSD